MGLKEKAIQKLAEKQMGGLTPLIAELNKLLGSMHAYMERLDDKAKKNNELLEEIRDEIQGRHEKQDNELLDV